MNILGLVASGRKLGNSEILAKEMLSSLSGEKRLLRLSELSIAPCHACYACLPTGSTCVIQDDLTFFLQQIEWADVIVLASPCYFLGAHTSLKTIGDRLISVLNDGERYQNKRCAAVITYGIPGWEGYAREAAMNFAHFLHLDVVGSMLVQAASPGETVQPDVLAEVRRLAGSLVTENTNTPAGDTSFTCPDCGSSLLQLNQSGHVRCVMCNATGKITEETGRFSIQFSLPTPSRFSPAGIAKHGQHLEAIKANYLAKRRELMALRKQYQEQDEWWIQPARDK